LAAGILLLSALCEEAAPANEITLSGNIEAHESLVGFKVQGRIVDCQSKKASKWSRARCSRALKTPISNRKVRIDEAPSTCANRPRSHAGWNPPAGIRASQQAVIDAQADLDEKKLDKPRAELLPKMRFLRRIAILPQLRSSAAEANLQGRQQRYNEAVEGSRKEDIAIARANLNEANANLGLSRIDLSYTTLRAPSTGVLPCARLSLAKWSPGSPVVTLADLDHIWLRAYIAEPIWAAFTGARTQPSPPTPIPANNITDASRSSRPMPSSHPRACRLQGARDARLSHQDRHRQSQS
jgi:HlyD family secretion protein